MKKKGLNALLDGSFSFFDMNSSGKTRKIIDDNSGNTHTIVAHILPDSVNAVLFPICLLVLSFMVSKYVGNPDCCGGNCGEASVLNSCILTQI